MMASFVTEYWRLQAKTFRIKRYADAFRMPISTKGDGAVLWLHKSCDATLWYCCLEPFLIDLVSFANISFKLCYAAP